MPSTSLLRAWAEMTGDDNPTCWGLDAVADELERLWRLEAELLGLHPKRRVVG